MNEAWLEQWVSMQANVLRRAKADVHKPAGGGNASLTELKAYIRKRGGGQWTLLETLDEYVVIKAPAPALVTHLGEPTLT